MKKEGTNTPLTYDKIFSPKEQKNENKIFPESDVYSLGKVFEIVLERANFDVGPELKELIKGMMHEDYKRRISLVEVIKGIEVYCQVNSIELNDEFKKGEMKTPTLCDKISSIREIIEKEKKEKISLKEQIEEKNKVIVDKDFIIEKKNSFIQEQQEILKKKNEELEKKNLEIMILKEEIERLKNK